jgi:RNA 2',3'-cyclic 3'-phosphodiesterase
MLRLFVAVEVPRSEQQAAAGLCTGLPRARWANPHQLHITLRFLGNTPEDRLPEIRRRLATVTSPGFQLALHGVGVFPPAARRPRVLWLGLEPQAPLRELKRAVDGALGYLTPLEAGADAAEFTPHLTLARLAGRPDPGLGHFLAQHGEFLGKPWEVSAFRLFKSTLHPAGAMHEAIEVYPLTPTCR